MGASLYDIGASDGFASVDTGACPWDRWSGLRTDLEFKPAACLVLPETNHFFQKGVASEALFRGSRMVGYSQTQLAKPSARGGVATSGRWAPFHSLPDEKRIRKSPWRSARC